MGAKSVILSEILAKLTKRLFCRKMKAVLVIFGFLPISTIAQDGDDGVFDYGDVAAADYGDLYYGLGDTGGLDLARGRKKKNKNREYTPAPVTSTGSTSTTTTVAATTTITTTSTTTTTTTTTT